MGLPCRASQVGILRLSGKRFEPSIRKKRKILIPTWVYSVVSDMKKIVQKTAALSFPQWALAVWDMDTATLYMVKYDRSH